jgi:restriction system protein
MLPLLRHFADGKEHTPRDTEEAIGKHFNLSTHELSTLLPTGQMTIFKNRVGWARTYLKKAGLLNSPKRGIHIITDRGRTLLAQNPTEININILQQYPEFVAFQRASTPVREDASQEPPDRLDATPPAEAIELAHQELRNQLADELLSRILECSPSFFEDLVVELLVKMGYGGSRRDAGARVGQANDGGIDGIIKEDRLGLDTIYLQAKRWQGTVGRPEIQKFVGALQGQRARKGVFITTSTYTQEATSYAENIDTKVVLIDGQRLAALMIDFDVGVTQSATYVLKKIDSDYFEGD